MARGNARPARWLAVLVLGFVAGAATVMLADPRSSETRVLLSSDASAAGHVHAESDITYDQLPKATKKQVDQVIARWATKYATAADAMKDGWVKASLSFYGIGAHYTHGIGNPATPTFDPLKPNMLLFDGDGPDAKFAGLSYSMSSATKPEGFIGPYDVWHSHATGCNKGGTIVSLTEDNSDVWLSESECTARGGRVFPIPADLMIHMWIGPGYLNTAPIFAHDHPKLFDGFRPQRDV